jgi:hypothetical protein
MTINEIWMILQETKPWAHFHPHVSWEDSPEIWQFSENLNGNMTERSDTTT